MTAQQEPRPPRWKGVEALRRDEAAGPAAAATGPPDFDQRVTAHGPALLRLAFVLSGNAADAEDVVQDALSRALPRWDRIGRVEDVDAYVRRHRPRRAAAPLGRLPGAA